MWDYNDGSSLYHNGVKGQKWGVRRYQNPDGTLTEEGKRRYITDENFRNSLQDHAYNKSEKKLLELAPKYNRKMLKERNKDVEWKQAASDYYKFVNNASKQNVNVGGKIYSLMTNEDNKTANELKQKMTNIGNKYLDKYQTIMTDAVVSSINKKYSDDGKKFIEQLLAEREERLTKQFK